MAFKDGQLLGFALSFIHKEEAYYWEGVTLREGEGLRPADALFTDLFTMALGRGLKRVNLGGSPQGAEGLVRYKEAWGASPVEYLSYVRITPWFNRLRELGRR
jgi:lipid II:glycine glycyltransferase (peptidoglycan interpeptide bridge formation enzyme)